MILSLWPLTKGEEIKIGLLIVSILFLVLGLIKSKILTPLNILWFKFGILLGRFVSPIVMGIIFCLVVSPTGYIMRLIGKDLLRLKKNKNSYWIKKANYKTTMKNQF